MEGIVDRIRNEGIVLGEPSPKRVAVVELLRMRQQTPDGHLPVIVYGNEEIAYSATPLDDIKVKALKMILRNARALGMTCTYYAIPRHFIKS